MIETKKVRTGNFNLYAIESPKSKRKIVNHLVRNIGSLSIEKPIQGHKDIQVIKRDYHASIDHVGKKYYFVAKRIGNNSFVT